MDQTGSARGNHSDEIIHGAVIEIEEGDAPPAPGEGCNRALCARKMLARIGVMRALNRHVEREWQRG